MAHHLQTLLQQWALSADEPWVLALITSVQGSSYRKPGAMMLFHPLGQSLGILSGGCLEADLRHQAHKALTEQRVVEVCYDARDDQDASYQLGCGGLVNICLLPLERENHFLALDELRQALNAGQSGFWQLLMPKAGEAPAALEARFLSQGSPSTDVEPLPFPANDFRRTGIWSPETGQNGQQSWLTVPVGPKPALAIFGGGLDAKPLAQMALQLDWQVSVVDPRAAYARSHDFAGCDIIKLGADQLDADWLKRQDGAIVMHHNVELDSAILKRLQVSCPRYLALLGPTHRRDKVLKHAGLGLADFAVPLASPAGLALGGELPGAIALSILAQCHGVLFDAPMTGLEGLMP
ncbi:XdhC family protein [Shewanella algae]|uniref:XdhC family protein n=1 Tax=Shewanella algae TaxID=38313 RepID=UPI0011826DE5|nr:XdhC/CoxI family protein [Shewanella algae]MBO2558604.1 XdhC family protein [Shewanella algae]MBO2575540.1 XdhC family protein [Shewanella algae]TVL48791.1 hypothetical protein AYI98_10135 [Shewanella algae]